MGTVVFSIPVRAGQTGEWWRFMEELREARAEGLADLNRRYGLERHAAWLQRTLMGDVAVVLHEGPGAEQALGRLAASGNGFDGWIKERLREIHGVELDEAPSLPELGLDSAR